MGNIKKGILSLVVVFGIILSVSIPAHAEWKETSQGWEYWENGTQKTRWLQDGSDWYYLGYDGIMKTGWVNDNGSWYYLMSNGILNDSKNTKTIPTEVGSIYNVVKFYDPKAKLYYNGLVPMPEEFKELYSDDGDSIIGDIYRFTEYDDYGIELKEYYYSPYDGCAYEKNQTETIRLGIGDSTINSKVISQEQAIQNVKNYINDNHKNMPNYFEIVKNLNEKNTNAYIVHFYNDESKKLSNHASYENGWYYVDKIHGNVISMYDL